MDLGRAASQLHIVPYPAWLPASNVLFRDHCRENSKIKS